MLWFGFDCGLFSVASVIVIVCVVVFDLLLYFKWFLVSGCRYYKLFLVLVV